MPFHPLLIVPLFLVFFSALWFGVTSLLGALSGWYRLQRLFPDRPEIAIERLAFQSGAMGPVNFGSCLTLEVCPGGLRVAVARLLGPLQRPLFVPWAVIAVERRRALFVELLQLSLGRPPAGRLTLRKSTIDRIVARSPLHLPD